MRIYRLSVGSQSPGWSSGHMAKVLGFVVLFLLVYADTSPAQVIPGRLNMLQQFRPVAPAPVPPVERLRRDIVRAIDPATGTIDARQLVGPDVRGRPGAPWGTGVSATGGELVGPDVRGRPGMKWGTGAHTSGTPLVGRDVRGRAGGAAKPPEPQPQDPAVDCPGQK